MADPTVAGNAAAPVWAIVPAGGSGSRLWPVSRAGKPKFLLPLTGEGSLLQQTVARLAPLAPPERTLIVCGAAHATSVARQAPRIPAQQIVVEPSPKGTGPAIALATALIARAAPDAVVGSFAADHHIGDEVAFAAAIRAAIGAASAGLLVTVGLRPTRAETGYGYVERTDEIVSLGPDGPAYRAASFHEKPDASRAAEFVAAGRFLWNASMFVWRAATFLDELALLQPELHRGVEMIAAAWETPAAEAILAEVWPTLPTCTIDQGVMERSERVAVVPAEMGWSDVGDWHGLGELIARDGQGNSGQGDLVDVAARDCVVWSETDRIVAVVGLSNVVVVDTPDALLVADRAQAQMVRRVVERLEQRAEREVDPETIELPAQ
jgi:mannose-1-phosphate guanylyltransferase